MAAATKQNALLLQFLHHK